MIPATDAENLQFLAGVISNKRKTQINEHNNITKFAFVIISL